MCSTLAESLVSSKCMVSMVACLHAADISVEVKVVLQCSSQANSEFDLGIAATSLRERLICSIAVASGPGHVVIDGTAD